MTKPQMYGVGIGSALASKKIGYLPKAIAELQSLIQEGANPRFLTIVPVERCGYCNGRGYFANALVKADCGSCFGFKYRVKDPASSLGLRKHNYDLRAEMNRTGRASL
jgi:hypothetical protein